jgi:glyoxylase-like metal-dependent hydrolase (beta-lactamase superfamily II)
MAFLDTRFGALIAGDAFQTRGRIAVAGDLVWSFPFPAFGTWHAPTAIASAKKLCGLGLELLAAGHGEVVVRPLEGMKAAIEAAERKQGGAAHVSKSRT